MSLQIPKIMVKYLKSFRGVCKILEIVSLFEYLLFLTIIAQIAVGIDNSISCNSLGEKASANCITKTSLRYQALYL